MQHITFLRDQERLYNEIAKERKLLLRYGTKAGFGTYGLQKGISVHLGFAKKFSEQLENIAGKVGKFVNAHTYTKGQLHTTLVRITGELATSKQVLNLPQEAIQHVLNGRKYNVVIKFDGFLYNQDAVILRGVPNSEFTSLFSSLLVELKKRGVNALPPKMTHITLARFLMHGKSGVKQLSKYLDELSFSAETIPEWVEVANFNLFPEKIAFTKVKRFQL